MRKKRLLISSLLIVACLFSNLTACKKSGNSKESSSTTVTVALEKESYTMTEDTKLTISAQVEGANGAVLWSSSDSTVVSVRNGVLLAKKVGEATITASVGNVSDSCNVTVTAAEEETLGCIAFENSTMFFSVEEKQSTPVSVEYYLLKNGELIEEDAVFTYETLDEEIATVDANGAVTPVSVGKTKIKVSCNGLESFLDVDIYDGYLSTTDGWTAMLGARGKKYLVTADIDFEGVAYTGYCSKPNYEATDTDWFNNHVNGNGHSIKNIQFSESDSGRKSVFGLLGGNALIENIAFENIRSEAKDQVFALTSCFKANTSVVVRNVLIDIEFVNGVTGSNAGLCERFYCGTLNNVLISIDAPKMSGALSGISRDTFCWGVTAVENVVVYGPEGMTLFESKLYPEYFTLPPIVNDSAKAFSKKMDVAWFTYNHFDASVWALSATELPALKK